MDVRHYCIYVGDAEVTGSLRLRWMDIWRLDDGVSTPSKRTTDNPDRVLGSLSLEGPTRASTEGIAARVRTLRDVVSNVWFYQLERARVSTRVAMSFLSHAQ